MKIAIDSRSVNLHSGTGIGTYTKNLISNILEIDKTDDFLLNWVGNIPKDFIKENTDFIFTARNHGRFFENHYIPETLTNKNIDLYHIPQNGIGFPFDSNLNTVVTIHDLIPYTMPETVGPSYLKRFLTDMPRIIEGSKGILTVSEYSKKDILRFFKGYPEDKIFVTPLATNSNYKPIDKNIARNIINAKYNFDTPYILYIGGFSSRKNVKALIDAFISLKKDFSKDIKLFIVGSLKDEGEILFNYAKTIDSSNSIIFSGFIDNDLLPTLYSGADLFVYPSLYEGFGLPPLEAMSCKTPVITSNITSIPEVTGDSALLINPNNVDELKSSIFKIIETPELSNKLIESGYKKSLQYSWRQTAKLTVDAYNAIHSSL